MRTTLEGYTGPDEVLKIQRTYILVAAIAYFVLVWDWGWNLANEWRLVVKPGTLERKRLSLSHLFLLSRYLTLLWCTFVIATTALLTTHSKVCNWFPYYTYGYSVVSLFAHLVMVLRVHSIYDRRPRILYTMLALVIVDFAIQMSANHWVTSVMLNVRVPRIAICFILPTSMAFSLVFISPTVFHHLILAMTLVRSIKHIRITKAVGIGSMMEIIQRDHCFYVLAICLINFTNLVLVLQGSDWPYGLVNQFPAAAFTQIFLSRIVFNLKHTQLKMSSASTSPSNFADLSLSPSRTFGLSIKEAESPTAAGNGDGSVFWDNSDKKSMRNPSDFSELTMVSSLSPGKKQRKNGFNIKSGRSDAFALSSYKLPSPRIGVAGNVSPSAKDTYNLSYYPSPTTSPTTSPEEIQETDPAAQPSGLVGLGMTSKGNSEDEGGDSISLEYYATSGPSEERSRMDSDSTLLARGEPEKRGTPSPAGDVGTPERAAMPPVISRRRTIDQEQLESDWDPPTAWQSPSSPRASPIPYDERRLSESIRSITPRGSVSANPRGGAGRRTGSVGYASLFSLDEVTKVEKDEHKKDGGN